MGQGVEIVEENDGKKYILNKSPADGKLIEKVPCSSSTDIDNAIKTLKEQQKKWASTPLQNRVDTVHKALSILDDAKTQDKLADMISNEMGKTLAESKEEVDELVGMKENVLPLIHEANRPKEVDNAIIVRDALGVVAVISPWNFPVGEIALHTLPALVAGNAVLVKPSEVTPCTGRFLVESLIEGSGGTLPLAIAQGDGEVGEMVVTHEGVNAVCMTGSSAVGKEIMQNCGKSLKRLILELGGKDPMVVFKDADLALAAKDAVECSTCNAGQVCSSIERIYVDSAVKDEFQRLCVEESRNVKSGPYTHDGATIGPMVSRTQKDKVTSQVDKAVEQGAEVLYVGDVVATEEEQRGGNYYPVTVLTNLTAEMDMTQQETFGPVVAIYEFDGSEEEAVKHANDSTYGLTASVYSRDLEKCTRVASLIDAGQVGVNAWSLAAAPLQCPWIGHKESGHGYHSGREGYLQFSVPKSIVFKKDHVGLGDGGGDGKSTEGYEEGVLQKWKVGDMVKTASHVKA